MRVLHVYSGNLYGGVETLLTTLARHRQSCPALDQHFALFFLGRLSAELSITGAPVYHLGEVSVRRPWTVWRARRRLADLLSRSRFEAVVCHSAWAQAVAGPAVRLAGRP